MYNKWFLAIIAKLKHFLYNLIQTNIIIAQILCNLIFVILYLQDCTILIFVYIFVNILDDCDKATQLYINIYFILAS